MGILGNEAADVCAKQAAEGGENINEGAYQYKRLI